MGSKCQNVNFDKDIIRILTQKTAQGPMSGYFTR